MTSFFKVNRSFSLSTKIILGLAAGILTGLFLGSYAYPFDYLGQAFIGLLQMTVLPYIVFSLIENIGRLSFDSGKELIIIGIKVLVVLLSFGVINLFVLQLALPEWQSSNFFSSAFTAKPEQIDFISLYIPSNPFYSLAASKVPAIVLFSIIIGVGLMKVSGKESFLNHLSVINKALNQVNKLIVKLTPLGVFAIATATVGTVSWEEFGKLQSYILIYTAAVLLMTLWVLPGLIAVVTPFKYKEVFTFTRATLLTIFATGKIIIVLPQLIDNINELFKSKQLANEQTRSTTDILMPLAYPFPNLGTFIILIFVPFAAWYSGHVMGWADLPLFLGAGLLSSFIAPVTGIPFLLDLFHISKDVFQLFFVSTVYTDRIRVVLGAMHLVALTVIATSIAQGLFKLPLKKLAAWAGVTVALYAVTIVGVRQYLSFSLKDAYTYDQLIRQIPPRFTTDVQVTELKKAGPSPVKITGWQSRLSRIRSRGILRVGFIEDYLPFSYRNKQGQLIGFDIEMAKLLATSLKAKLVLVPANPDRIKRELAKDYYDIVMSGMPLSSELANQVEVSHSYLDLNLALLTKSYTDELKSYEKARTLDSLRVAYVARPEFVQLMQTYLPQTIGVSIPTSTVFVEKDTLIADALLTSAESGAYISLLHPEFKVVNPFPEPVTVPVVYPVGYESTEFLDYVNNWIIVNAKQGKIDKLYQHWILGRQVTQPKKNWSVIKDVLHWVE